MYSRWEAIMAGFFRLPGAGLLFFASAWLLMIFAGIVTDDIGIKPFGYLTSMIATIGLWLVIAPAATAIAGARKKH
jgi:branched-subunit amino acid ABC-type transport system permease component